MNKLTLILICALITGCGVEHQQDSNEVTEIESGELHKNRVSEVPFLGSGHADLEGALINYDYRKFGGFYVRVESDAIKWRGYKGAFTDVVRRVIPQISKVAEGVFFLSWETTTGNGDNVVFNFNDMMVAAHLGGRKDTFALISGDIHCLNTSECSEPVGEVIVEQPKVMALLQANAAKAGMTIAESVAGESGPADEAGMKELTGKTLSYNAKEGKVSVTIDGDKTIVSINDEPPKTHVTHATRVAEGVYFVSWAGSNAGNHIVVNTQDRKVYDQIMPDGLRQEAVYDLGCFGDVGQCR